MDDAYDDYAGQIKCYTCGALMQIAATGGKLTSVMLSDHAVIAPALVQERVKEPPRKERESPE